MHSLWRSRRGLLLAVACFLTSAAAFAHARGRGAGTYAEFGDWHLAFFAGMALWLAGIVALGVSADSLSAVGARTSLGVWWLVPAILVFEGAILWWLTADADRDALTATSELPPVTYLFLFVLTLMCTAGAVVLAVIETLIRVRIKMHHRRAGRGSAQE